MNRPMLASAPRHQGSLPSSAVATAAEAHAVLAGLLEAMDALLTAVERETALVRAGRLREAAQLETEKSALSARYLADVARVKASLPYLSQHAPELVGRLRERHQSFHALLQINLTVLATVHAVSETIVRGVAAELARKSAPQTYGATGRHSASARAAAPPISVSRTL